MADTSFGNAGLNVAKDLAATGIWLDRQTRTTTQATQQQGGGGGLGVLDKFDILVDRGGAALRDAFYASWAPVALMVLALIVLFYAARAHGAKVMRVGAVAIGALWLAGLAIGAPMATVHAVDDQFTGVIGDVQGSAMRKLGVDPATGPRDVVVNDVVVRQWKTGWFGDPDSNLAKAYSGQLRDSLALSYDDQDKLARISRTCTPELLLGLGCQGQKVAAAYNPKHKEFTKTADAVRNYSFDSYGQFTGKQSNRTTTGWTAAAETFTATILWIFASLLKFVGLLIVRLAVLFAPIWIPAALISETVLMKLVRFIGAALFWAVAASAVVAAHLVVMVQLFDPSLGFGNGWRVFLLALVTAVLWTILRPFKRLTQFASMNVNATAGGAWRYAKQGGRGARAAAAAVGGAAGYAAGKWGTRPRGDRSDDGDRDDDAPPIRPVPQEGAYRYWSTRSGARDTTARDPVALDAAPTTTTVRRIPAQSVGALPGQPAGPAASARPSVGTPAHAGQPVPVAVAGGPVPVELAARNARLGLPAAPVHTVAGEHPAHAADTAAPSPTKPSTGSRPVVVGPPEATYSDASKVPGEKYAPTRVEPDGELVYQVYSPDTQSMTTVYRQPDGGWA